MRRSLLFAAALLLCGTPAAAEVPIPPPDVTAVRVNGVLIPQERIQTELTSQAQARTITHGFVSQEPRPQDVAKVLDRLITRELLVQEARSRACVVSDGEVAEAMEAERGRWGTQERYEKSLTVRGIDEEYLRERVAEDCLFRKLMAERVEPGLASDEAKEREYYESNRHLYMKDEPPPLHMIRISAERHGSAVKAYSFLDGILQRRYQGEQFPDLAREVSDHPSAAQGGFIGENPDPTVPFLDEARKLRPRQFTNPLLGEDGAYLFFRLAETDVPRIPFEEVRPQVRKAYLEGERAARFRALLEEVRAKARIEYLTGPAAPATPPAGGQ